MLLVLLLLVGIIPLSGTATLACQTLHSGCLLKVYASFLVSLRFWFENWRIDRLLDFQIQGFCLLGSFRAGFVSWGEGLRACELCFVSLMGAYWFDWGLELREFEFLLLLLTRLLSWYWVLQALVSLFLDWSLLLLEIFEIFALRTLVQVLNSLFSSTLNNRRDT